MMPRQRPSRPLHTVLPVASTGSPHWHPLLAALCAHPQNPLQPLLCFPLGASHMNSNHGTALEGTTARYRGTAVRLSDVSLQPRGVTASSKTAFGLGRGTQSLKTRSLQPSNCTIDDTIQLEAKNLNMYSTQTKRPLDNGRGKKGRATRKRNDHPTATTGCGKGLFACVKKKTWKWMLNSPYGNSGHRHTHRHTQTHTRLQTPTRTAVN